MVDGLGEDATRWLDLQVPFLRAPAACWWALATVESTEISQVISPSASAWVCRRSKIRCQVPSRCQRLTKPYTVSHGPLRSGRSRHGMPVRVRNRIPLISCRLLRTGGRPGLMLLGTNGSNTIH